MKRRAEKLFPALLLVLNMSAGSALAQARPGETSVPPEEQRGLHLPISFAHELKHAPVVGQPRIAWAAEAEYADKESTSMAFAPAPAAFHLALITIILPARHAHASSSLSSRVKRHPARGPPHLFT